MCYTWYVEELARSCTRVLVIIQVGCSTRRCLYGIVTFAVDPLADGMVCSVWSMMSLAEEDRGEPSDRVLRAAREDAAEKCRVTYVLETVFWRGGIPNWTELDRDFTADARRTCDTTKVRRSEYDRRE